VTRKALEKLRDDIRAAIASKGLDNSGAAFDSLEISRNQLLGADYFYYLDKGRGPGKFPPLKNIVEWVRSKLGLEGSEAKGVAYVIGKKISEKGTEIYRDNSKGINLDALITAMLTDLQEAVADEAKVEVLKWL
jgi:hypothetical protein